MNHLQLHTSQISLELARTERKCEMELRSVTPPDPNALEEVMGAARGIMNGLAVAACMWLIVLATVVLL